MKVMLNDNVMVMELDEEIKDSTGLLLTSKDKNDLRYSKGKVIRVGEDCGNLKEGDNVYYDTARAFSVRVDGEKRKIIRYGFIVGADPI